MADLNINWSVDKRKVADLKLWDKNPRTITKEAFERLKDRIIKRGFHDVIKIDIDNTVLSGNQRKQALVDLGVEEVSVLIPDRKLTDEEREKIALESNRNDGVWDYDMLANDFDIELLKEVGFTEAQLMITKDNLQTIEDPFTEWKGLPEFEHTDLTPHRQILISFQNEKDVQTFAVLLEQNITEKTKSLWFPEVKRRNLSDLSYEEQQQS
jgi:hypothetical protein